VILAFAGVTSYSRYAYQAAHPADVQAASGMFAAGDMMLEVFIAVLLILPTLFLIRLLSGFEGPATVYSKLLLLVALSAPLALGIFVLGETQLPQGLGSSCFLRLLWSPFVLALIVFSRAVTKFQAAKRFASYALVSEGATFCVSLAMVIFSMGLGQR
jgi:hypothetical protein